MSKARSSRSYHSYQAFGLTIASTISLPELLGRPGKPDVIVEYGAVPNFLAGSEDATAWCQQNAEAVLFKIDSIAKYLIQRGEKIVIERSAGSYDDEVRLYLFGSAFGALLHQRGLLPLHGSAVEVGGGAVAFVGPPGYGKSTLAGAFLQRGYRILTDDVCAISVRNGESALVYPGFPRLKLWSDTLTKLGQNPDGLRKIMLRADKRHLALDEGFCTDSRPLRSIYELSTTETQKFMITPLQGVEKMTTIMAHTYRPEFLGDSGKRHQHFQRCAAVGQQAAVRRIMRPESPFLLEDLVNLVEQDLLLPSGEGSGN